MADSGASSDIDLLIGSVFYWDFVTRKVMVGKTSELAATKIAFEYI